MKTIIFSDVSLDYLQCTCYVYHCLCHLFLRFAWNRGRESDYPTSFPGPNNPQKAGRGPGMRWAGPENEATLASRAVAYAQPELTSCMDGIVSIQNCVKSSLTEWMI